MLAFIPELAAFIWEVLIWAGPYVALYVGLHYLGGALRDDEPEDEGDIEGAQSRSWRPHTKQQEGPARPRAYGKNMHLGNITAKWTDVADDHEILYLLVDHGEGPTKGIRSNMVYLNDQPVGNFGSVVVQERIGTMDQDCMDGFEKNKLEYPQNNIELVYDEEPVVFTTPNDFFEDLEYTLCFPNGLMHYRENGDKASIGTTIKVRIREIGGIWTEIYNDSITRKTLTPLFFKFTVSDYFAVVKGTQYELEFSRLNARYSDRSIQNVHLRSVREVVNKAFTYPGRAIVGIKAIATPQLHGHIDVKVIREDRIINTFDGTSWTLKYSKNRAWVDWDIFTAPVITGNGVGTPWAISRYERRDPSELDLEFFYKWSLFCDEEILDGKGGVEHRCDCNTIIDYFTDIFTVAYQIAKVGRANIYNRGDLITGWIDDVVTTPKDLVTMDSMMKKSWKNDWAIKEELAGNVEVSFKDEDQGYESTYAGLPAPVTGGYKDTVSIEGLGITSRGAAFHLAHYLLERKRLIVNTNEFEVSKEGFRHELGDTIYLQCRIANWGHAFRVVSATADTITVDRDATDEVSVGDAIHIRSYDTLLKEVVTDDYWVDAVVGKVIKATVAWDVTPVKGNLVAVGPAGAIKLRRIIGKKPTMKNLFIIKVETYTVDLFDSDDIDPNNPNANYIWPGPASDANRPVTHAELFDLVSQILPPQPDIEIPWPSNVTWNNNTPSAGYISWSKTNADEPITFMYRGVTYEIDPGNTTAEFVYWDPDYTTVFRTTNLASTALAPGHWLMCTNKDGIAHPANGQQLMHCAILLAGTLRAETYLELRNTYVYNGDDSLDTAHPFEIPFKIVSEMIAIKSVKLSFKIMSYRAYSVGSTAAAGGGQTSSGGSSWPWGNTSAVDPGDTSLVDPGDTSSVDPGDTNYTDLGSHYHEMPTHDHDAGGRTEDADGTGSHYHNTTYNVTISSEDPGNTYDKDLYDHRHTMGTHYHTMGTHRHTMGTHYHALNIPDHTHTVSNHTHTMSIVYGLHTESNSPTVHYHIDNGAGFGGASGNYTTSQLDLDITGSISGSGWKGIRFDTNLRCRIAAIIECKLDIDA